MLKEKHRPHPKVHRSHHWNHQSKKKSKLFYYHSLRCHVGTSFYHSEIIYAAPSQNVFLRHFQTAKEQVSLSDQGFCYRSRDTVVDSEGSDQCAQMHRLI